MISNLPIPSIGRVLEVTEFKDERSAVAAIETLKWLDSGAPHKFNGFEGKFFFDMEKYIDTASDKGCGTACCIAGAISLHKTHGKLEGGRTWKGSDCLDHEFGTGSHRGEHHPLSRLFYPHDERGVIISKTPEQAAKALRQYLFTGKVDWE